jgi:simple sugar transport system ATP-binding protein
VPHLELRDIRKSFGPTVALDGAHLALERGEIHALLGENGAGKTTLVGTLYGLVRPDRGEIRIDDQPVEIRSPAEALRHGIGLVHQHSVLAPALTVAENLALGAPSVPAWLPPARLRERAGEVLRTYALELDPDASAGSLPVAHQQRLEIVRALTRGARVLVLDEPTAVLSPSEVAPLLEMLSRLRQAGRTVVFISHKLEEVTAVCDRVTVLRKGRTAATRRVSELDPQQLGRWMVGIDLPPPGRPPECTPGAEVLRGVGLQAGMLRGVDLSLREGEILAIAGIDGNGQGSLEEVLAGVRVLEAGELEVRRSPLAVVAGDRQRSGLVLGLSAEENLILHDAARGGAPPLFERGFLRRGLLRQLVRDAFSRFDVQGQPDRPAATLSGGNQQRLLLARALRERPAVLVAVNPTRGLDVRGTAFIREELRRAAREGTAVLLISTDLDEVLELGNRISVLFRGTLADVEPQRRTRERIGELMLGRAA